MQKTIEAMKAEQGKANLTPIELAPKWVDEELVNRGKEIKYIEQTWRILFTFDKGKWHVFDHFVEKPPIPKSQEVKVNQPISLAKDDQGALNLTVKNAEYIKAPAANDFDDIMAAATQVGANVRLDFNANNSVILEGVDLADLDASDFNF